MGRKSSKKEVLHLILISSSFQAEQKVASVFQFHLKYNFSKFSKCLWTYTFEHLDLAQVSAEG